MYLKSLTLRGFKSFASATTLAFEPGITCVVGPNGSGKSNVVDALSWVMGEQGAKTLRGGKMEDVIFAGTSKRSPLGRAEVVLTIDNTDGALPIEYTEVTISRTMFRSGGSEYAINGHSARLLDVQELLSDSGIGREMHVIVGQGQLDSILNATPETRRGFIEEAAGVLKHRKRKEKAQRKLDSTAANLNRLQDLLAELRRQLKPLGRQAEVARRAAGVQAEVFDAKARLLADDYAQARAAFDSDKAAEDELKGRRVRVEEALGRARAEEAAAEQEAVDAVPELNRAQETWYALAGLRERASATAAIAAERVRSAEAAGQADRPGRDPEAIEREAENVARAEEALDKEVLEKRSALEEASRALEEASGRHADAEQAYTAQQRAIADRREGLAKLAGEVNTLRSRAELADAEIERLGVAMGEARRAAEAAQADFAGLEATLAQLGDGESGLDEAHEAAEAALERAREELSSAREAERSLSARAAALAARVEALRLGADRKDAEGALLASDSLDGVLGAVAALVSVPKGDEAAVAAALGTAAEAVALRGVDAAVDALGRLKAEDLGRAGMLLGGADPVDGEAWPELPKSARYAADVVQTSGQLRASLRRLLRQVALVSDLDAARALIADQPEVVAVTPEGDVLSAWFACGGSAAKPSSLEIQAAVEDAEAALAATRTEWDQVRAQLASREAAVAAAKQAERSALAELNESDAKLAAVSQEANALKQAAHSALAESGRLETAITAARQAKEASLEGLRELEERLERANQAAPVSQADSTERDDWAAREQIARAAEMDARLALRTLEERGRALRGRAESLRNSAQAERRARAEAAARAEQLRRDGETARAVGRAVAWLAEQLSASLGLAEAARSSAQARRDQAEARLREVRAAGRELAKEFEGLVDSAHRDELARAQRQMRLDQLAEKAMEELGYEPDALLAEFGPEVLVGVGAGDDGEPLEPVPYVRAEQERRLRAAERDLAVLGKVNPLALEEFEAMQERHGYLAGQLEDLRQTRADLVAMIEEVDAHMEQVFMEAYDDVAREFETSFDRLFPGGEGKLVLTEPDQWLTTGVDVEARPAGKKVKRLSLLSGGERSLVAVAFLVALFKARPSPFYILDEVEAALDDVNLGRLLEIYEELRANSQLLVITHQKRTMEIADALYGITMGNDGVSVVISQRLRED